MRKLSLVPKKIYQKLINGGDMEMMYFLWLIEVIQKWFHLHSIGIV